MEIQNLKEPTPTQVNPRKLPVYYIMVALFGIFTAFWLSRFFPSTKSSNQLISENSSELISADNIDQDSVQVGKSYGNANGNFSDTATGVVKSGSINGVGTHILEREGGIDQRASLTSSILDLDLFIDRKVQIRGETNSSDKTSWLLDVGSVTVLE
jgi:hypothetical protein